MPRSSRPGGFDSQAIVSHTLISAGDGFAQGFRSYDAKEASGHDTVSTEGVTRRAIRSLEQLAAGGHRFFLFVHYFDPHFNYVDHPEVDFAGAGAGAGRLDGSQDIGALRRMCPPLRAAERAYLLDLYDEEIRHTDAGIGQLLARLAALGIAERTAVVVTADHGEEFLERGWIGHTRSLHEELIACR